MSLGVIQLLHRSLSWFVENTNVLNKKNIYNNVGLMMKFFDLSIWVETSRK